MVPILQPTHRWQCPSCAARHVTHEARPHVPMHPCPALDLVAPFVEVFADDLAAGSVRHVVNEREDYVGDETCTYANGRPIMSVSTERADGSNDIHAFAGLATRED